MNNQRVGTIMAKEGIANAGDRDNQAPLQDNHVLPLEEVAMGDQVPVIHLPMTIGEIRETFHNLA